MSRTRRSWLFGIQASALLIISTVTPIGAQAAASPVTALLGERRIEVSSIPRFYCHDLEFPIVRCFRTANQLEQAMHSPASAAAVTAVVYVTIFDGPSYQASYMHVSADYEALASVGWNDRVSSYKAKNSETGVFYTDWFRGGTPHAFCCNQGLTTLGGFDNSFSSVYRT